MKAEIRENDEKNGLEFFSDSFVWKDTSLKNTITGTPSNLDRFTLKQLEEYRSDLFSGDNMFFYLTGNVTKEDSEYLSSLIEKADIKADGFSRKNVAPLPEGFLKRNCLTELNL